MEKITKKVAEIVSIIFNPLFLILLVLFLAIDKSNLTQKQMLIATLLVLVLDGLTPIYVYLELARRKVVIDDILGNQKALKNRPKVLAWWMILFLVQAITVYFWGDDRLLFYLFLILLILTLLVFLVSLSKKISLHMAYATLFALMIIYLFGWNFWPTLLIIPLIAWSRYYLMRHTINQLLAGLLASSFVAAAFYFLINYIKF